MTGDKLAGELMQIRPDILIILCTGYSERITEEKANGMGIRAFVIKPLVMRDLANTVRKVLDELVFKIYGVVFHSMLDSGHQAVKAPS
jgi:two-component system cell cycle sensor histidine kinase/response regulator CckA